MVTIRPLPKNAIRILTGLAVCASALLSQSAHANDVWLTGDQFRQALGQTAGATWRNIPLRRALESFSQAQKIAILLDRRVDPEQNLELTVENAPLAEVFQRVASRMETGTSTLGPVVYFGPPAAASRLRTVAAIAKEKAAAASEPARKA